MKRILLICFVIAAVVGISTISIRHLIHVRYEMNHMPKPNFSDLPEYQSELELSRDPRAKAILKEIADGPQDLARQLAAAKAEGLRLDAESLRQAMPPASQNAVPIYDKLSSAPASGSNSIYGPDFFKMFGFIPPFAEPLDSRLAYTSAELDLVRKQFAEHQGNFQLLHKAASLPYSVYPLDINMSGESPFVDECRRNYARIIVTESYLLAADGKYREAIANQSLGFGMADQGAAYPGLLELLVNDLLEDETLRGMQNILYLAGTTNPSVDDDVLSTIRARYVRLSLPDAIQTDAAMNIARFTDPSASTTAAQKSNILRGWAGLLATSTKPSFTRDQTLFIDGLYDAELADFVRSTCDSMRVATQYAATGRYQLSLTTVDAADPITILSRKWSCNGVYLSQIIDKQRSVAAFESVTMAAAAVMSSRARTGAFPNALPPGFIDPYSGKSLLYRREGAAGFVIYSVGPTGDFEGSGVDNSNNGLWHDKWFEFYFRYPAKPVAIPASMLRWPQSMIASESLLTK